MMTMDFGSMRESAKKAYPNMSEEELGAKFDETGKARDTNNRLYLEQISGTNDNFEMKLGMVAQMDFMKAASGKYDAYEKAEDEVFKPVHQKMIDQGYKGSWSTLRMILPRGSEALGSHVVVNFYSDYAQFFKARGYDYGEPSEAAQAGFESRENKWVVMATLQKMVRPEGE